MIIVIFVCSVLMTQNPWNSDKKQVFVDGYDMVTYFQNTGPQTGKAEFQVRYKESIFYFTSSRNQQLFTQNPEKYLPAYGGWCAYAMGYSGEKVKVDPETFKIVDGKVNLFYNFRGNNTLLDWNENESSLRQTAEVNWRMILEKEE